MKPTVQQRYEINVKLLDTHPPVWRRLDVPGEASFSDLHQALQISIGWSNRQPHVFTAGKRRIGLPEQDENPHLRNERKTRLRDVMQKAQTTFHYVYDPDCEWTHELFIERIYRAAEVSSTIVCLDGKRAAPPEDIEGALGYQELLAVLADPDDPDHEIRRQQVGADFDPEAFAIEDVNAALASLREKSATHSPSET